MLEDFVDAGSMGLSVCRRKIEDLCRDLIVNNDHIHAVEQRLRYAIDKGLGKETHKVRGGKNRSKNRHKMTKQAPPFLKENC